jgi:adenine phosphoribosyltransferase
MNQSLSERLDRALRVIPDFPKPGIQFRDITPLLADAALMRETVTAMSEPWRTEGITHVVGVESRGFLFGVPMALELGVAFVPARKPGKLPSKSIRESFSLEYGSDALELHADAFGADAFGAGARVLVVDDILATGGTLSAACRLVERLAGQVAGVSVLGAIDGLCDPAALAGRRVVALLTL